MKKSVPLKGKTSIYDLLFESKKRVKKKEKKNPHQWFFDLCKSSAKIMGKSVKNELTPQYKSAMAFLGWDLKPRELNAAPMLVMYVGLAIAFVWAILNYALGMILHMPIMIGEITLIGYKLSPDIGAFIYFGPFALALYAMYYIQSYPIKQLEIQKIQSIGFIPELVNYFVMAMKVTPNLERGIKFVAEHGHGKIAKDFKALQYDIHVGKYRSVEEALDYIAWQWGEHSEEFKHALMMIRSSVMEADENKRNSLLDKAVQDVLQGVQEKMDFYSRSMTSPSTYLYYFGVLLPLLLIIVIPVGAMMGGEEIGMLASFWVLAGIYNLLIPGGSWIFAQSILQKRPPTREVPDIPDDHPGLPNPGWFNIMGYQLPTKVMAVVIALAVIGTLFVLNPMIDPRPRSFEPGYEDYCLLDVGGVCVPFITYAGLFLGVVYGVSFYLWALSKDKRKVQLEIMDMEDQFQDTLYVLASRLGEGRPMEDALKSSAEFLPNSPATKKIFIPTLQNILMMGMTLKMALFDEAYGSLRHVPSPFIRSTMLIVVDSLNLGVQTAARSLISLSLQIRDSQKVEKALKAMLQDITGMMATMSMFIAPVVLGITIALQQIIMGAMASMSETGLGKGLEGAGSSSLGPMSAFQMPTLGNADVLANAATQSQLLFIISFYMIEIVFILMYYASTVNEGRNDISFKMAIATAMPISLTVFFIVTFFAMKMTSIGL